MSERYSDLGGRPSPHPRRKRYKPRPLQVGGCQHTEDPAGWILDPTGMSAVEKCPCWEEESPDETKGK